MSDSRGGDLVGEPSGLPREGRALPYVRGDSSRGGSTGILPVSVRAQRARFHGRDARATRQLGQPKIHNLGLAPIRHENICWLNVAVDDAL